MAAPTPKQRAFFEDLVKKPGLMDLLDGNERIIVRRAQRVTATFAQVSQALDILRDKRTLARRTQGVEPTPTPQNTFPDRVSAYKVAVTDWVNKVNISDSLLEIVDMPMRDGACMNCGHAHEGRVVCTGVVQTEDPRYKAMAPRERMPFNTLSGSTQSQCSCTYYEAPESEAVMAWEAMQAADEARTRVTDSWRSASQWKVGDVLVVARGRKYPIGTRGVFLRQHEKVPSYPSSKPEVAYLLRVSGGIRVEEDANGKKEFFADSTVTADVDIWVSSHNCDREDDDIVPSICPSVNSTGRPQEEAA